MFKNLRETIKVLNADVNNVVNSEKAKKLRSKLIRIGLPITIVGFWGAFVCFILFATAGEAGFGPNGFTARIIVPFILFVPFGIVGGIGATITSLGLQIIVTGYTTNLINETVGNICQTCGANLDEDHSFCPKCGAKAKKECPQCNFVNDNKNEYCSKCGTKLN